MCFILLVLFVTLAVFTISGMSVVAIFQQIIFKKELKELKEGKDFEGSSSNPIIAEDMTLYHMRRRHELSTPPATKDWMNPHGKTL